MKATIDPRDFGAAADGRTLDTAALQRAVDAAPAGATVLLEGGVFRTGTLRLKSGSTLEIAEGAVLEGSPDIADYADCGFKHPEMGETTSLVYALGCEDVALRGGGTVEMNGPAFMDWDFASYCPREIDPATVSEDEKRQMVVSPRKRPTQPFFFDSCRNVSVNGLRFHDSPCWTLVFSRCEGVAVEGISVVNHRQMPNCDGVHASASRNVRVSDCFFDCGDDCFAATCITDPSGVCEDIVVERCTMASSSAAIRFGHLDSRVRRAVVRDCVVKDSNRAVCVFAKDGGSVSDILFERVSAETSIRSGGWWGKGEPFVVCAARSGGTVDGVTFRDCSFVCENPGIVAGTGGNVRDVALESCTLAHSARSAAHPFYRGKIDIQPNVPGLSRAPWADGDTLWIDGAAAVRIS